MKNQINPSTTPVKDLVKLPGVQKMLNETMHEKAAQFRTSIVNIVNDDKALQNVDQMSVIQAAMISASLNLPINKNLGYIWLVPYWNREKKCRMAQAQVGYKGYIQLALRTGQYKKINAISVYEGELVNWDPLTEELEFDVTAKQSDKVIGYAGFFELTNGFKKSVYWTKDQMVQHKDKFSKSKGGPWATDFDAMAVKTVLRNMLTKWGIMSTEMVDAYAHDGSEASMKEVEGEEVEDSEPKVINDISQLGQSNENDKQESKNKDDELPKDDNNDNSKQKNKDDTDNQKLAEKDSDKYVSEQGELIGKLPD